MERASGFIESAIQVLEECEHEALPLLDHALALVIAAQTEAHRTVQQITMLL